MREQNILSAVLLIAMILFAVYVYSIDGVSREPIEVSTGSQAMREEQEAYRLSLMVEETQYLRQNMEAYEKNTTEETITDIKQRFYPTNEEFDLMARVVMSEAGGESFECQLAVAETIINRVLSEQFPNTVSGVIHQANQYSTADNGKPTDSVMEAVQTACEVLIWDSDMVYFRDYYYHSFGTPFMVVDDMYFSLKR